MYVVVMLCDGKLENAVVVNDLEEAKDVAVALRSADRDNLYRIQWVNTCTATALVDYVNAEFEISRRER